MADFALYPVYAACKEIIGEAGTPTHLTRWGDRMAVRPGVQKGMQAAR